MMGTQRLFPKIVDSKKPEVIIQKVFETSCPNPSCNKPIEITNLNEGTKIECPHCKNITWTPSYEGKYKSKMAFFIGLLISFIIGVCSSLVANYVFNYFSEREQIENIYSPNELEANNQ